MIRNQKVLRIYNYNKNFDKRFFCGWSIVNRIGNNLMKKAWQSFHYHKVGRSFGNEVKTSEDLSVLWADRQVLAVFRCQGRVSMGPRKSKIKNCLIFVARTHVPQKQAKTQKGIVNCCPVLILKSTNQVTIFGFNNQPPPSLSHRGLVAFRFERSSVPRSYFLFPSS